MTSPAKRFMMAALAAETVKSAGSGFPAAARDNAGEGSSEYQLLLQQMGEYLLQLRTITGKAAKSDFKRKVIDEFGPHCGAAVKTMRETGTAVQDEILTQIMVWFFDIAEFDDFLNIAKIAMEFGLKMPSQFSRDIPTFIAEELSNYALDAQIAGNEMPFDTLLEAEYLLKDKVIADQQRAKLKKAIGFGYLHEVTKIEEGKEPPQEGAKRAAQEYALQYFRAAFELDRNIGVKKEIERLTRQVPKAS